MANHNNYYNKNLELARSRKSGKQELEEEQRNNEFMFKNDKVFEEHKLNSLDCQVYLYEEPEGRTRKPRVALVFHFKHLFDITIEGVAVDNVIINVERLALPQGDGHFYNLTPTFIKCIPLNVVNYGSKGNKLNGTAMLNPRDWAYQALASLSLDNLVQNIDQHKYISTCPPQIEPKESLSDTVRNFASGLFGLRGDSSSSMALQNKHSKKKVPVEIPQITVPHVPSEYDQKERQAVVIRYNKDFHWAIIFHFEGDDAFRTVQGAWDEGILKPSYKKSRPEGDDGMYMELGTIQISPSKVRDITLENLYNGATKDSGVTEMEWAKIVCNKVGLMDKWNSGEPWKYVHPPQYTVAPDRTVFLLPSSRLSGSVSKS